MARARARMVVAVFLACLWGLGGAMILLGTTGGLVTSSHAESQAPLLTPLGVSAQVGSADQDCLTCHGEPGLTMTLDSGEMIPLYVDSELLAGSVHGDKLDCSDCHVRNEIYPHASPNVYSARDFARAEYELCKRCHFENYTKTLDSIHYEQMA
ncbi:MAG: cytochrome c3 family protein, partial [Anaerolineae bacterium]